MAKKKSVSKKSKPVSKKKKPVSKKKSAPVKKTAKAASAKAAVQKDLTDDLKNLASYDTHERAIQLLPTQLMEDTIEAVTSLMNDFTDVANNNLTALQRRRKIGPGVRNYGFIDKVSDLATANPQFAQFFKLQDLKNCIRNIEACRDLALLLQSFARAVTNTMLIYSDDAYSMALIYYNNVREMSRRGDPVAMELFRTLRVFFHRTRQTAAEPTQHELERDVHALLHGKADGKVVIENIAPQKSGGARKVIDDVHRGRAMMKESAEAQVDN